MRIKQVFRSYIYAEIENETLSGLLNRLERFACILFNEHWFRNRKDGIAPSGDEPSDFVIRAIIHSYPEDGIFKNDFEFKKEAFLYIYREISRESRLKINSEIKNEAYYSEDNPDFKYFDVIPVNEPTIRDRLLEEKRSAVLQDIVKEFRQYIKNEKYKMIVDLFNSPRASFDRMLTKVTDHPIALINELIDSDIIIDDSGLMTEKCKRLNRPCKLNIKIKLKGKRGKSHLFCILKMNGQFTIPRYNAHYLGIDVNRYYYHISRLQEQFKEFLLEWKSRGSNAEILDELGLFQEIQ